MTAWLWVIGACAAGLGLLFGPALLSVRLEQRSDLRRATELRALAVSRDWRFDAEPQPDPAEGLLPPPFGVGEAHLSRNQVTATVAGLPVLAFDHRRRTRTTNGPSVLHVQALLVRRPGKLPLLTAYPRGVPYRFAVVTRHEDVPLGDPALDGWLRVQADDLPAARRVLDPLLPALGARSGTVLDTGVGYQQEGGGLVLYRKGRLEAADLAGWLAALEQPLARLVGDADG